MFLIFTKRVQTELIIHRERLLYIVNNVSMHQQRLLVLLPCREAAGECLRGKQLNIIVSISLNCFTRIIKSAPKLNKSTCAIKDWIKDTFTAHSLLLPFCASFIPKLAKTVNIDIPNLWVFSTQTNDIILLKVNSQSHFLSLLF